MKQLAQYQDGRLEMQEVPLPSLSPGGILVRSRCSVVSPGTERMKLQQAQMSLLAKAKARPDQVRKVLDTARTLGWKAAYDKVKNRLESPTPLGYSLMGEVIAVDPLNRRFHVGDRVACGGAECAFHAEVVAIPDMLAAKVPDEVSDSDAAYTTLSAIALQALRQAELQIGERALVIGQGLIGLLITQLLRANGVQVIATDLNKQRLNMATSCGADLALDVSKTENPDQAILDWSGGEGIDCVLICVGGKGPAEAELAIDCLRERGSMVIVGMYDAPLSWKQAYMKDIQVRYSRSYGAGRYDPSYEWGGVDYPISHVRWTENRNFSACLELMRSGTLNPSLLTTLEAPFTDALGVYKDLLVGGAEQLGVVLHYGQEVESTIKSAPIAIEVPTAQSIRRLGQAVSTLNVIGAGNFARSMLLPHLQGKIKLGAVVNQTALSANHCKSKFGFTAAATDAQAALDDPAAAVLIATRHHLHADLVLRALRNNQQVFVEKPLCLTRDELTSIQEAAAESSGSVMLGFNRRYAPATVAALAALKGCHGPIHITYRVNAGRLAAEHWYSNIDESGGRILGEACHFFDFFCFLTQSTPRRVFATSLNPGNDGISASIQFVNGSTAQLLYTADGDSSYPKESWSVLAANVAVDCHDFRQLVLHQNRKRRVLRFGSKGHAEEMQQWLDFLLVNQPHPQSFDSLQQAMLLTFTVLDSVREQRAILLSNEV